MLNHVNSVFVSNNGLKSNADINALAINDLFVAGIDEDGKYVMATEATASDFSALYVGLVTGKTTVANEDGTTTSVNEVHYSRPIQKGSVASAIYNAFEPAVESETEIAFGSLIPEVGYSYTLRIVRTDVFEHPAGGMPYSYTYFAATTSLADMLTYFAKKVNKDENNGVIAVAATNSITLTAEVKATSKGYTGKHPVNLYDQVQFDAFVYQTMPSALLTHAQYAVPGVTITKTFGVPGRGNAYIVRDRENAALGYRGILYRENGIYPYIAPELNVDLAAQYNTATIEFNNKFRSSDMDYIKSTPLTIEVYTADTTAETVVKIVKVFAGIAEATA